MMEKRALSITVGSIFFAGLAGGVLLNLTANKRPAPQIGSAAKITATPTPSPTPTPTPTPVYSISGSVYIDTNQDGNKDSGESNYTLEATVSASLSAIITRTDISDNRGRYTISGLQPGEYSIYLTPPDGYTVTGNNPKTKTISGENVSASFGIIPTVWLTPKVPRKVIACEDIRNFVKDHCGNN